MEGESEDEAKIQKTETKNSQEKDVVDKVKTGSWVIKEEAPETREGVEMDILEAK